MSTFMAYARILACGLAALIIGALSIDWLGTSWWSRILAILAAAPVMAYAFGKGARGDDQRA